MVIAIWRDNMGVENILKPFDLWEEFKEEILNNNRYFCKHEVLNLIDRYIKDRSFVLKKDDVLYRGRVFQKKYQDDYKAISKGFYGYNQEESTSPIEDKKGIDGRINPPYIVYLYASQEPYTALVETRPYFGDIISLAEIKVLDDLNIMDFTRERIPNIKDNYTSTAELSNSKELFDNLMLNIIAELFYKPVKEDKKDYILTQYISEYIKHKKCDGIKFNSSLYNKGSNIAIFYPNKCEAINSSLYSTNDICMFFKAEIPDEKGNIFHEIFYKNVGINDNRDNE